MIKRKPTKYLFGAAFADVERIAAGRSACFITDEHIFQAHKRKFARRKVIVLPPGEKIKTQETVNEIIHQLIDFGADRKTLIVGVGGGVITDLAGYVASVYMRGLPFGFIPTSVLAMVDAAIGGKNGVDVGPYKNLVGTIRQPEFLLYDASFLRSLPESEWINGFAEVIKHACIKDAALFKLLEQNKLRFFKRDVTAMSSLIKRNAGIKRKVVEADEFEQGERRLLNFGHTWGHAIETRYDLPHGHAVAIGMVTACRLSEQLTGFKQTDRVINVLQQYGLPVSLQVNEKQVFDVLRMDKKKDSASMNYVLLNRIGQAVVKNIPLDQLWQLIAGVPED